MKILGIDYGKRKIGLAISDEKETFAFPLEVILNNNQTLSKLEKILVDNNISTIVIGESKNRKGENNQIMFEVNKFVKQLEKFNLNIIMEPEFLTTQEARRIIGSDSFDDARAAALILKSYLDRK